MKSLVIKTLLVISVVALCCAFAWADDQADDGAAMVSTAKSAAKGTCNDGKWNPDRDCSENDSNMRVKETDRTIAEGRSPAAPCVICEYLKSLQARLGDDTGSAEVIKQAESGSGTTGQQ